METRYNILLKNLVYTGKISEKELKQIVKIDPTTTIKSDVDIKVGKYSNWLLRNYIKAYDFVSDFDKGTKEYDYQLADWRHQFIDDIEMNKHYLTKFDKYKSRIVDETKRDIMNISGFGELIKLPVYVKMNSDKTIPLIDYVGKINIQNVTQIGGNKSPDERFKFPGSEIMMVGEKYTLVKINDQTELGAKAAAFFGGKQAGVKQSWDTEGKTGSHSNEPTWCTAIENGHHFNSYIKSGALYIILSNDIDEPKGLISGLPRERYQLHFTRNEFRDRNNMQINIVEYLKPGGLFNKFSDVLKDEFIKDVSKGKFTPNIDNYEAIINYELPNPGAMKRFIEIYGVENVIDVDLDESLNKIISQLSNDIKILFISNPTDDKISVSIPDLSRFTSLESLKIHNCIKNCDFSLKNNVNLEFLTLTGNQEEFRLPTDIEKLNKLLFVSLEDSPNVILNDEFNSHFIELETKGFYINPKNYEEFSAS